MEARGLTQAALAKRAGLGQTTVSLYLAPERRKPSKSGKAPSAKLSEVEALADALGVQLWELLKPMSPEQRDLYRALDALVQTRLEGSTGSASGSGKQRAA